MKLFSRFPKISYPTEISPSGVCTDIYQCTNIMVGVKFREILNSDRYDFYPYIIRDGDRPDIIAHKYYGSPDYTWIIFYANDIMNPLYGWPLTQREFVAYLKNKYAADGAAVNKTAMAYVQSTVHHYLNANGYEIDYTSWLDLTTSERSSKTIYEWEMDVNEEKRPIRLLEARHINTVLAEFRELMKTSK